MCEIDIKYKTDFLFSKCSFWRGVGSVLNIPGNYYEFNTSNSPEEADTKALISDWENVGHDIKKAKKQFEVDNQDKLCLK